MAPLPSSTTARLKVTYANVIASHVVVIRCPTFADLGDAADLFTAVVTGLGSQVAFSDVTQVQAADVGSDLFFDVAGSSLLGDTFGSGPASEETNARFVQFSGRSIGGRRTKLYIFGWKGAMDDYRLTGAEDAAVLAAVTALNAAENAGVAIDGLTTVYNNYANLKAHDHWVHKARTG